MAAVAASTAASVVVSTEVAALAEAVFTPPDLVAAVFAARRLGGAQKGRVSLREFPPYRPERGNRPLGEAHDGQPWAEKQAGGGPLSHVRLPLMA